MLEQIFNGCTILVGQNAEENDTLVKNSNLDDYWLHLSVIHHHML